jgi:hypothetical protein
VAERNRSGHEQRLMRPGGNPRRKRRGKPWRTAKAHPVVQHWPDLVERDFSAIALNRPWVGAFTQLR